MLGNQAKVLIKLIYGKHLHLLIALAIAFNEHGSVSIWGQEPRSITRSRSSSNIRLYLLLLLQPLDFVLSVLIFLF